MHNKLKTLTFINRILNLYSYAIACGRTKKSIKIINLLNEAYNFYDIILIKERKQVKIIINKYITY